MSALKHTKLISVVECIAYIESLGYVNIERRRGFYMFRSKSLNRPAHNWWMGWTLTEMRHAVKYGC